MGTQTLKKISISKSVKTQTVSPDLCEVSTQTSQVKKYSFTETCQQNTFKEHIFNVVNNSNTLPLISVTMANTSVPLLIDTGSTISLLSSSVFNKLKHTLKYKHLASQVSLATVNSHVNFSSCIKLTFKINQSFFNHNFYIVDIPESYNFQGFLGFDFLQKYKISLNLHDNVLLLNDLCIPLTTFTSSDYENQCNTVADNTVLPINYKVFIKSKEIIKPYEEKIITVTCKQIDPNKTYLFECNSVHKNMICFDAVVQPSITTNVNNQSIVDFNILIKNITDSDIHLNKQTVIGFVYQVDEIQEYSDDKNPTINDIGNNSKFIGLIKASSETLQQRKQELNVTDFKLDHLDQYQSQTLQKILLQHSAAFSKSLKTLGHTDRFKPNIKFINTFPIKTLPFPIPQALQQEALTQINELVEAGIIQRNCSEWACPILLVKKKSDGTGKQKFRLALDLRMLNTVIQPSSYPLPKIQSIISNLSQFKYFTSLDFMSAYHQIDLPEEHRDKFTFTSMYGNFSYNRVCFGCRNSAQYFQALMDLLVDEMKIDGIFVYQDDFIVGANSFEETCAKIKRILQILVKYNLTLSPAKCSFHQTSIDYLGFHIQNHTIAPIKRNIMKITSFPTPTTKRQLKGFIGLATFYKSLIPSFSELIQPLIDLTKPKSKFIWTESHQKIFNDMQKIFFLPPMVRLPDWNKTFYVNTDASGNAISGALLQKFEDKLLPIAYFSKSLKPSEKRYPALKLELMAIYKSVNAFNYYLYNRDFVILSDSAPLKKYRKTTNPADITTRWLMHLSKYSFTFKHIPGSVNVLADYLSRCPLTNDNFETLSTNPNLIHDSHALPVIENDDICDSSNVQQTNTEFINYLVTSTNDKKDPLLEISNQTFVSEQAIDPKLSVIYQEILNSGKSEKHKDYFIHPDSKVLMLKKHDISNDTYRYIIIVPDKLKSKVLAIAHFSHFGLMKTYEFLSARYFWRGMYTDTLNFVSSCRKCLQLKHHNIPNAPLQSTYTPKYPGHTISIDLVGPFKNQQSILTVIDHFSRHIELYPLKSTTTDKIVKCLFSYMTTFGRPSAILSDLGPQFTSHVYNTFNNMLGIKIRHSSVAHPASNSISERINTSLKYSINILMQEGHTFENSVYIHKNLYNGSTHSSTSFSPNLLHFGRELSLIFDTYDLNANKPFLDQNVHTYQLFEDLQGIYKKAFQNIKTSQSIRNEYYHRKAKLREIYKKDIVYLKSVDKFKPKYTGPYIVVQKHSPVSFSIKHMHYNDNSAFRVHIDRLLLAPPRSGHLFDTSNNNNQISNLNKSNTHSYNLRSRR